jgi:hypothetical protein
VKAFLEDLRLRGVVLSVRGEKLRYDAPPGVMTDDLKVYLLKHKPELIKLLLASPTVGVPAAAPAPATALTLTPPAPAPAAPPPAPPPAPAPARKPVYSLVEGDEGDLAREVSRLYVKDGARVLDLTQDGEAAEEAEEETPGDGPCHIVRGTNADLIAEVAPHFIRDGDRVADTTFGRGAFWRKTNVNRFTLLRSDIKPRFEDVKLHDFRELPYAAESIDTGILDPPYIHNPGKTSKFNKQYQNFQTTKGLNHASIVQLYVDGMREMKRVIKENGFLWVKAKDEVECGKQKLLDVEIIMWAIHLGFYVRDRFTLIPPSTSKHEKTQQHAHKNRSFLLIFEKTAKKRNNLTLPPHP